MKRISKNVKALIVTGLTFLSCILIQSCKKEQLVSADTTTLTLTKISDYGIFSGTPTDLIPTADYKLYEVSSQLYTDEALKQRLVMLPPGTKMTATDSQLLNFPEGMRFVKTFYYLHDQRNPASGKRLIETRILQLTNGEWVAGTYRWNEEQTEANLIGTGLNETVNWIDKNGSAKVTSYHIPSNLECKTCHNTDKTILPLGPKVRNLNFDVSRNNTVINQLIHLQNEGILQALNPQDYLTLPDYTNTTVPLENRARAYLDVNCGHCHKQNGFASQKQYRFEYETDLNSSNIREGKGTIKRVVEKGEMPKIGSTIVDEEGLALLKSYLETL